jgi:hypothetical protein
MRELCCRQSVLFVQINFHARSREEHDMRQQYLGLAGVLMMSLAACATDTTPSHPNYAAAIADLRVARIILDHESEYSVIREQYRALESIDRAVLDLKDAAIVSGQPLGTPPTLDPALDYGGRLHRARELLDGAAHELSFREDDRAAQPARSAARDHVDDALKAVDSVIQQRRDMAAHP